MSETKVIQKVEVSVVNSVSGKAEKTLPFFEIASDYKASKVTLQTLNIAVGASVTLEDVTTAFLAVEDKTTQEMSITQEPTDMLLVTQMFSYQGPSTSFTILNDLTVPLVVNGLTLKEVD